MKRVSGRSQAVADRVGEKMLQWTLGEPYTQAEAQLWVLGLKAAFPTMEEVPYGQETCWFGLYID
jgi:hypothetical protein